MIAWISLALLGAACAGGSAPGASPTPTAMSVRLTTRDTGRHVTLRVGEHLILALGGSVAASGTLGLVTPRWSLTSYPRALLRLISVDPATGQFDLLATTVGTGDVRAVGRVCGPPLADQVGGPPCPVAGAVGAPIVLIRLFGLTVTVA